MAAGDTPIGVLHINLGSPAAPTAAAVRAFLEEFLGDPLVVDANPLLWWLVRKALVLPRRARRSADLYRRIWTGEGSPLIVQSRRFVERLARELGQGFRVAGAMRYGEPSIEHGLRELAGAGCGRVVLLTAFPQASRTTTGTIELAVRRALERMRRPPQLALVPPYYADPGHIAALAALVSEALACGPVERIVFSFHGLPQRYVDGGDPYREHCEATARALAAALGLAERDWTLAYQSRFGRGKWLEPHTAALVLDLAATKKRVLVCAPSFTTDCLETLEELGLRLCESFLARGGAELRLVPSLNDHPRWASAAADLVRRAAGAADQGREARQPKA